MPHIVKVEVFKTHRGYRFYEKKLVNDDGKDMSCPLREMALGGDIRSRGKSGVPADTDCTDDCVFWHTFCDIEGRFG